MRGHKLSGCSISAESYKVGSQKEVRNTLVNWSNKIIGYIIIVIANVVFAVYLLFPYPPEPRLCALCDRGENYHAPVLLNLSTGEIGALHVYHPNPVDMAELAVEQTTGSYRAVYLCGAQGYYDWGNSCFVQLPAHPEPMRAALFCSHCREQLSETASNGYAVVDYYDLRDIQIYPVTDGAEYKIRDYTVLIYSDDVTDKVCICVRGTLPVS